MIQVSFEGVLSSLKKDSLHMIVMATQKRRNGQRCAREKIDIISRATSHERQALGAMKIASASLIKSESYFYISPSSVFPSKPRVESFALMSKDSEYQGFFESSQRRLFSCHEKLTSEDILFIRRRRSNDLFLTFCNYDGLS